MQTVYTTNMAELQKTDDGFRGTFGKYSLTSTWIEIEGLFHPEQMVEISGVVALD